MKTIALRVIDILTRIVVMIALVVSLFFNYVQYHNDDTWAEIYDKERQQASDSAMEAFKCEEELKGITKYYGEIVYDRNH